MLSAEAVMLALLALATAAFPSRHIWRQWRRRRAGEDVPWASWLTVAILAGYCWIDFADQTYWAHARYHGMPATLVYGWAALALKAAAAAVFVAIIWLYSTPERRATNAIAYPLGCVLAGLVIDGFL